MSGIEEVAGEAPAAAANLHHQPSPPPDRLQPGQEPWSAGVGVGAEALVVHEGEVSPVVVGGGSVHAPSLRSIVVRDLVLPTRV